MIFKDERTIILLFIYFFHLENIITKISLVNEPPYKMGKPVSLYPGYQRFFFPRVRLDASVSARGRRSSVEGRSIFSHAGHNLKSCLKPETAHEKSLAHTVKTL